MPLRAAWPLWLGAAALLLAALLAGLLAPRWAAEADAQLQAVQAQTLRVPVAAPPEPPSPAAGPAAVAWPTAAQSPARSEALVALAGKQGLALQVWREQVDAQGQLQLSLSGRARYPALRAFVAAALRADPAASLDRLRLQRDDAATAELDFEMQWTLLQQPPPAAARPPRAGGRP
jgi:Tfp pilus assembly protein PilN